MSFVKISAEDQPTLKYRSQFPRRSQKSLQDRMHDHYFACKRRQWRNQRLSGNNRRSTERCGRPSCVPPSTSSNLIYFPCKAVQVALLNPNAPPFTPLTSAIDSAVRLPLPLCQPPGGGLVPPPNPGCLGPIMHDVPQINTSIPLRSPQHLQAFTFSFPSQDQIEPHHVPRAWKMGTPFIRYDSATGRFLPISSHTSSYAPLANCVEFEKAARVAVSGQEESARAYLFISINDLISSLSSLISKTPEPTAKICIRVRPPLNPIIKEFLSHYDEPQRSEQMGQLMQQGISLSGPLAASSSHDDFWLNTDSGF